MSNQTWRDAARSVIAPIEREYRDKPLAELKTALREAYPFGQRAYFPYKVWCEEQRKAIARHPESLPQGPEYEIQEGLLF
jgi:hypothetical protein